MAVFQYSTMLNTVATTVTSGGTITLINTSATIQVFTGTSNETVTLPVATTFTKPGVSYELYNFSSGSVQVNKQDSSSLQTIPANSTLIINLIDASTANGTWSTLTNSTVPSLNAPTSQVFTSGSGTYTTPSGPSPLYLKVTMMGGGGGGGGIDNSTTGGTGTTGGVTTFGTSLLTANGGLGGQRANVGGIGGTATVSAPATKLFAGSGGTGEGGIAAGSVTGAPDLSGGNGASGPFGGEGGGGNSSSGSNAIVNTGAGGGGCGSNGGTTGNFTASGGGAGGYVMATISSPSSTYSFAVGSGGAGYAGAVLSGGNGGSGIIIVEEHYQ